MINGASLENALEWFRDGGLSPAQDPRAQGAGAAFDRRAMMFAQVFGDTPGQAVLHTILEASLFRAPVDHRLEGESYLRFAQLREGQNQLAATILAYLDHARTLMEKPDVRSSPGPSSGPFDPGPEPGPSAGAGDAPFDPGAYAADTFTAVR